MNIIPEFYYNNYSPGSWDGKFETWTISSFFSLGYNKGFKPKCVKNQAGTSNPYDDCHEPVHTFHRKEASTTPL